MAPEVNDKCSSLTPENKLVCFVHIKFKPRNLGFLLVSRLIFELIFSCDKLRMIFGQRLLKYFGKSHKTLHLLFNFITQKKWTNKR